MTGFSVVIDPLAEEGVSALEWALYSVLWHSFSRRSLVNSTTSEVHLAFLRRGFEAFDGVEPVEALARLGAAGFDAGADPFELLAQEALAV